MPTVCRLQSRPLSALHVAHVSIHPNDNVFIYLNVIKVSNTLFNLGPKKLFFKIEITGSKTVSGMVKSH